MYNCHCANNNLKKYKTNIKRPKMFMVWKKTIHVVEMRQYKHRISRQYVITCRQLFSKDYYKIVFTRFPFNGFLNNDKGIAIIKQCSLPLGIL